MHKHSESYNGQSLTRGFGVESLEARTMFGGGNFLDCGGGSVSGGGGTSGGDIISYNLAHPPGVPLYQAMLAPSANGW